MLALGELKCGPLLPHCLVTDWAQLPKSWDQSPNLAFAPTGHFFVSGGYVNSRVVRSNGGESAYSTNCGTV